MNIDHLKEFAHLANTLNFSTTAQHFYVSTSVISRHIASLEDELGFKLFDRGNGHVKLTKAGEMFVQDARVILHDYDNAIERLSVLNSGTESIVRVGYLHEAARPFIARFVRYVKSNYPKIAVVFRGMKFSELYSALDEHRVDLNFMLDMYPYGHHDYHSELIYEEQLYVVVNKENPLTGQADGVTLKDLVGQNLLLPNDLAYPGLADYIRSVVSHEPALKTDKTYVDLETLYLEVEINNFVGFSSGFNRPIYGDRVAFLLLKDVETKIDICAFWRDSLEGSVLKACEEAIGVCRKNIHPWAPGHMGATGKTLTQMLDDK